MSESDKIEPHILKRFQIIKKIGSGAYGVVWKVTERNSHKSYALKKNFDAFQNSTDAQRTFRQIMYLKKFNHANIIQPKEVIRSMNEKDIYIMFEYMDIDLYTLIRQNMLGEQHKRYIIYQSAKAIYYLHTAELIHRDIKPSNVLVNEDCLAKICDFGLVRSVFQDKQENFPPDLTEYIATRWYRAPEILLGSKKYSKPADVWSFGCMLGQIILGKPMFPGNSTLNQIERVITWTGPPSIQDLESLQTQFGKEMLDILTKIKQKNRKDWFVKVPPDALDLISRTLTFNPSKRPTMLQVLKHPFLREFYSKSEVVDSKQSIMLDIKDADKLTLKEYRAMIYKLVEEDEQKNRKNGLFDSALQKSQSLNINNEQQASKTIYKNRFGTKGLARSASKNKQDSIPKSSQKESNTMSIKKKYESLLGKGKDELIKTKYVKTEEIEQKDRLFPKRKKSDNIVKYYTADKKKKSVSLYQAKRDSEMLARYMYQHRKI